MNLGRIIRHIECYIRHVQEIVSKIFLNNIAFVPTADNEVVDAVLRVYFHDMPQNRPDTDFNHWFRLQVSFFGNAGAKAAR